MFACTDIGRLVTSSSECGRWQEATRILWNVGYSRIRVRHVYLHPRSGMRANDATLNKLVRAKSAALT